MSPQNPEDEDRLHLTTVVSRSLTPENVEAEAKRFAKRTGGILLMAMADMGLSEEDAARMLEVSQRQLRNQFLGEAWRSYLPLAAMCLAFNIKLDLKISREL